ncbi:MAG: hemolysin, partial [Eikenella corrodens]|nr:hemolysin [Eikenella corrodens]
MQQTKNQEWLLVDSGNLEVSVTREADAVEEAQRLRFDIFGREMGAGIHAEDGRDIDRYDEF